MNTERRYSEVMQLIKDTDKPTLQPTTTLKPHPLEAHPLGTILSQTKISDGTFMVGMVGLVDIKKQQLSFSVCINKQDKRGNGDCTC